MKRIPLSRVVLLAAAAALLPAITFADDTPATTAPATTTAPALAQKSHAAKATPAKHWSKGGSAAAHRVDLNSATREDLMTLPGIDGTAADKIIAGRPWKSSQSLVEKNVLTKADFAKLKSKVMAKHMATPAAAKTTP